MSQSPSRNIAPFITVMLVCALASAVIWMGTGILNTRAGGDSPFLLIRTYELAANLRAGIFPARWMPDAAYGLGYPFFNFYAALPYYIAALLNVAGVDLVVAIKLTQTLGMFAAGAAMWLLARKWLPAWGSALAAGAYVLAPFHLVNVVVRGDSLSEFWAFVWYPLILWAVRLTIDGGRRTAGIVLALSLAGLVLTHNVSAVLFAPFIVIFALALLVRQSFTPHPQPLPEGGGVWLPSPQGRGWGWGDATRAFICGAISLLWPALLALALSAWFWLPALGEAGDVQLGAQTTGYFNYSNHFRSDNLVQPSLAFHYAVNENGDAFAMGLVQAMLVVLGAAVWLLSERKTQNAEHRTAQQALSEVSQQPTANCSLFSPLLFLALFALSTFMITPASAFIWEHAPLLKLAQFPWRMLSVQAVFAAILIGGIARLGNRDWRLEIARINLQSLISLLLLLWSALTQLPNARLNVQGSDVSPASIQLYEWYTGNIGTTIRAEYLPKTALPVPRTGPALLGMLPQAFIAQDETPQSSVTSQLVSHAPDQQVWRITTSQDDTTIVLPLLHSWAWEATINGIQSDSMPFAMPYAGSGWTQIRLITSGEHIVVLDYTGTFEQHIGNALSLVALLLLMACAAVIVVRAEGKMRRRAVVVTGITLMSLIALWLARVLLNPPSSAPQLQTLDFNTRPFLHRDPVIFAKSDTRYELIGARIEPSQAQAGQPFTLTLAWKDDRAPSAITVTQELPSGGEFMALFRHARAQTAGDPRSSTHIALPESLRGVQLIKLQASDANGNLLDVFNPDGTPLFANIAGKQTPAITLPGPFIFGTTQTDAKITAMFSNSIALHGIDWFYANAQEVCFRPQWSLQRDDVNGADALQVSLRLRGDDGRMIAQADSQPQGGLAPTWSWQRGVLIYDSQCVPAQNMLDAGESYTLQMVWYRVANLQQVSELTLRGTRGPVMEDLNVPR